jgi:hypothetical protein
MTKPRLPRKLKRDIDRWLHGGVVVPSRRVRRWVNREFHEERADVITERIDAYFGRTWAAVRERVGRYARCASYRPDHNGECLNCDEPSFMH